MFLWQQVYFGTMPRVGFEPGSTHLFLLEFETWCIRPLSHPSRLREQDLSDYNFFFLRGVTGQFRRFISYHLQVENFDKISHRARTHHSSSSRSVPNFTFVLLGGRGAKMERERGREGGSCALCDSKVFSQDRLLPFHSEKTCPFRASRHQTPI